MNKEDMRLILANRFLHGSTFLDKKYSQIKTQLFLDIKDTMNENTLQELLSNLIGNYNEITADLYLELATKYLRYKTHRKPTIEAIFDII